MKNLLLIHEGRVGSTALVEQIKERTRRRVLPGNEIYTNLIFAKMPLHKAIQWNAVKSIIRERAIFPPSYVLHEYKIFPETDHMRRSGVGSLESLVSQAKQQKSVFLLRRNVLHRALSVFIASESGTWHRSSLKHGKQDKFVAPLKNFFLGGLFYPDWPTLVAIHARHQEELLRRAEKSRLPVLFYEDIFLGEEADIEKVLEEFSVEVKTVLPGTSKPGTRVNPPVDSQVVNYVDILAALGW